MAKHIFGFLILIGVSSFLSAQTIKTDVLVIGNTAGSIAAAIQASRSGVKTILLTETASISPILSSEDIAYLEKIQNHYTYKNNKKSSAKDSIVDRNIGLEQSSKLLKGIIDTVKNLTVIINTAVQKIEKNGKKWEVKLQDGKLVKTLVVIDGTENLAIAAKLKIDPENTLTHLNELASDNNPYMDKLFRSSIAIGYYDGHSQPGADKRSVYTLALGSLLPKDVDNFLVVPNIHLILKVLILKPIAMSVGQATGAIAAYCAFFKTTTKDLNARSIQSELLSYDSQILPFKDIKFTDPNAMAFQHIGLCGLLKIKVIKQNDSTEMQFDTVGTVSSEELRLPMKEYYSRSQIWFADHKKEKLTIEDTINLFMFTATRGEELRLEIEKNWKESFKFNNSYDPKRIISRMEFAVLADRYLQPFNIRIDLDGNLLN